jgi:hypothetical protein
MQPIDSAPTDIFKTNDRGKTWQFVSNTSYYGIYLQIAQPDTLWMNGHNIAHSFDGGNTWNKINSQYYSTIVYDFELVDGKTAWALGRYNLDTYEMTIKYTEDGGKTFEDIPTGYTYPLTSIEAVKNASWVVGAYGTIIKYQNEVSSAVNKKEEQVPEIIDLEQNSPNPFNPITTINYSIMAPGHVSLSVYNLAGQKVATLVNGNMSIGNHSVSFDGSSLASGVYFYRFEAEKFNKTGKMLLVK